MPTTISSLSPSINPPSAINIKLNSSIISSLENCPLDITPKLVVKNGLISIKIGESIYPTNKNPENSRCDIYSKLPGGQPAQNCGNHDSSTFKFRQVSNYKLSGRIVSKLSISTEKSSPNLKSPLKLTKFQANPKFKFLHLLALGPLNKSKAQLNLRLPLKDIENLIQTYCKVYDHNEDNQEYPNPVGADAVISDDKLYILKNESYKELKPWDWIVYTDDERLKILRNTEHIFEKKLKLDKNHYLRKNLIDPKKAILNSSNSNSNSDNSLNSNSSSSSSKENSKSPPPPHPLHSSSSLKRKISSTSSSSSTSSTTSSSSSASVSTVNTPPPKKSTSTSTATVTDTPTSTIITKTNKLGGGILKQSKKVVKKRKLEDGVSSPAISSSSVTGSSLNFTPNAAPTSAATPIIATTTAPTPTPTSTAVPSTSITTASKRKPKEETTTTASQPKKKKASSLSSSSSSTYEEYRQLAVKFKQHYKEYELLYKSLQNSNADSRSSLNSAINRSSNRESELSKLVQLHRDLSSWKKKLWRYYTYSGTRDGP